MIANTPPPLRATDPPILVAALIAARRVGDRTLELFTRRELERCGIAVRFLEERKEGAR